MTICATYTLLSVQRLHSVHKLQITFIESVTHPFISVNHNTKHIAMDFEMRKHDFDKRRANKIKVD